MSNHRIVFIGGGGHCLSVIDAAKHMGDFSEIMVTDPLIPIGNEVENCKVIGSDDKLQELYNDGVQQAFLTIGDIGNADRRQEIYNKVKKIGFQFPTIIDPSAVIADTAMIGMGVFIGKGAVINAGAVINDMAIINTGAIIEHDCRVGAFTHVAVGAVVCGGVRIGDRSFIGANATIIQGVNVGQGCLIGAGSVVLSDVCDTEKVVGVYRGEGR